MSFFREAYDGSLSVAPESVATSAPVGFTEAFSLAYEAQTRAASMYGLESKFWEAEQEQIRKVREKGGKHPSLSGVDYNWTAESGDPLPVGKRTAGYLDAARFFVDGGTPDRAEQIAAYDEQVLRLREQYPDLQLKTAREMFDDIRSAARKAEEKWSLANTTAMGTVGGFTGGMAGALDPAYDPLNVATFGVGGVGRTAAGRILSQGAGQGAIEAVNQVTGVQENRRLFGLETGFANAAENVLFAAAGGALLQGTGEALRGGYLAAERAWFKDRAAAREISQWLGETTPNVSDDFVNSLSRTNTRSVFAGYGDEALTAEYDGLRANPAMREQAAVVAEELSRRGYKVTPEGTQREAYRAQEEQQAERLINDPDAFVRAAQDRGPLATLRQGLARTRADLDQVTTMLDDWAGPRPWEIMPRAETFVRVPGDEPVRPIINVRPGKSADELAREIDPDTFRQFDELAKRKETYRRWLSELEGPRDTRAMDAVADIDDKIEALREKAQDASARNAKRYGEEISALQVERERTVAAMTSTDTPDMARIRQELMRDDFRMRELAPLVSRAYARAREQWQLDEAGREGLRQMIREGRTLMPQAEAAGQAPVAVGASPRLEERAPILATRPDIVAAAAPTDDAATIAARIVQENAKRLDEALEAEMAAINALLENEDGTLRLAGQDTRLRLDDKVAVPVEDGEGFREMTVRGLLNDMQKDADEIKAVTTCSIKRPS